MKDKETLFLEKIAEEVDKTIDKIFDKFGFDRAYYGFNLTVELLNEDFEPYQKVVIIQDRKPSLCVFCNRETYYFDEELQMYLCFEHYLGKLKSNKNV